MPGGKEKALNLGGSETASAGTVGVRCSPAFEVWIGSIGRLGRYNKIPQASSLSTADIYSPQF